MRAVDGLRLMSDLEEVDRAVHRLKAERFAATAEADLDRVEWLLFRLGIRVLRLSGVGSPTKAPRESSFLPARPSSEAKSGTCCACGYAGADESPCLKREDGTHCAHWWDGVEDGTGGAS